MSENNFITHIANASYKNVIKNKSNTDNNLAWYEEPSTVYPKVEAKSIWLDSDYIPNSPKGLTWRGNYYYTIINDSTVAVIEKFENIELSKVNERAVFYSDKLIDAIQNEDYHIIIRDSNNEEIPFGLKKWTIDSGIGYLSFTDGMPDYVMPFYVSGYRYCGRKLPEHMITTDGRQEMLPEYYPEKSQQLTTKIYVDNELKKISDNVDKMIPPVPDTFESKDIIFKCDGEFSAVDIKNNTVYEHVILPDYEFTLEIPEFYNPGYGEVSLLISVNSVWNEVGKITLSKDKSTSTGGIVIDYDGDAYADSLASRGFYNIIRSHFTSSIKNMSSFIISHINPMIFKLSYRYNDTLFYSNELIICEEFEQIENSLNGQKIVLSVDSSTFSYRYVSGIVTPVANSIIRASSLKYNTLRKFTKGTPISKMTAFGLEYIEYPSLPYSKYSPSLEIVENLLIPDNLYQETTTISAETYNIFNEVNGSHSADYNFRIDTISDETNRVTSGVESNKEIIGSLDDWDSKTDLRNVNELQMLAGKYQWPELDFSINGTGYISSGVFSDVSWIKPGLNYSICSKTGIRYVTLKYDMKICNGVFIKFIEPENIKQDKETHAFNVESMYIKVANETDWLDAKNPYDGIGINNKWMQGCLSVQNSNEGFIYCTFGPKPIEGTLFIRVGVSYNQHIKFKNIEIKEK